MSFFNRFKWTSKGPHSLGRKNSNNISARYRGVHPSFIGQFDLLTCGNSDPGTSGILSPFSKIDGLYFNTDGEPDSFLVDFVKDINRVLRNEKETVLEIEFENEDEYYAIMNNIERFLDEDIRVFSVDRDKPAVIFEREPDMIAEHEIGAVEDGTLTVEDEK